MLIFLLGILVGTAGSFWRAWFGGSFFKISRIWQILVLFILYGLAFFLKNWNFDYLTNWHFYFSWVFFMRFWNHTHGDYFKVNDCSKDEPRSKWVDWCLQKIFGKDNYYNYWGNVTGLFLGYTVPAIGCAIFINNLWFSICGGIVAWGYGLMGRAFPEEWYTKYAEYLVGFLVFFILYICI